MSNLPGLVDPFNSYFDEFSIHVDDLAIPAHFDMFEPDNQDDYNCTAVICPSVVRGAKKWTINGQWITIGIYRDEGRKTALRPPRSNLSWTRSGVYIQVTDPAGHKLRVGDEVELWNFNVPYLGNVQVREVIDANTFKIRGHNIGQTSGTEASYRPVKEVNFYETYRVFRLLPSFKLISLSDLTQIFINTLPDMIAARRSIYDITKNRNVAVPRGHSVSVNYELPSKTLPKSELLPLHRRFGQPYDEAGQPLKLAYQTNGYVMPTNNVDSPHKNRQLFYNSPLKFEGSTDDDSRIYVYDYYGVDLNDPSRNPYFSTQNVTKGDLIFDGVYSLILNHQGGPFTNKWLYDAYGNLAVGVQENNALVVRKQILPLELDSFNKPIKQPTRMIYADVGTKLPTDPIPLTESTTLTFSAVDFDGNVETPKIEVYNISIMSLINDVIDVNEGDGITSGNIFANDTGSSLQITDVVPNGQSYGSLVLDAQTGDFTYELNNSHPDVIALNDGESLQQTFDISVTDGIQSSQETLTVVIHGVTTP